MLKKQVMHIIEQAMHTVWGGVICDPLLHVSQQPGFDYQVNGLLRAGAMRQESALDLAAHLVAALAPNPVFECITVSGPGFINIRLNADFLSHCVQCLLSDARLGVVATPHPQTIVVDYGSANIAKEMHVGHLRSMVIGDAVARVLSFLGHHVIRQSHIGDFGTQFGMLIEYLMENQASFHEYHIETINTLYQHAQQKFSTDADFARRARQRVVALQNKDASSYAIWEQLVRISLHHFTTVYAQLGLLLTEQDIRGESFYSPLLKALVDRLIDEGWVTESQGARVVALEEFSIPCIVQKQDGAYLYATTDLAAADFRIHTLKAQRIIYVTDARQKQHFDMLFAILKRTGISDHAIVQHVSFGSVLDQSGKPFKTREGAWVPLTQLFHQAYEHAMQLLKKNRPSWNEDEAHETAQALSMGAIKYADLRSDKIKDYVFEWKRLLSFDGNTAPYLQNAYVRICAIFRKINQPLNQIHTDVLCIQTEIERNLVIHIASFSDVVHSIEHNLALHCLCDYLYGLASCYHKFYEQCPILSLQDVVLQKSRLALCQLTARVLSVGFDLIGIPVLEKM